METASQRKSHFLNDSLEKIEKISPGTNIMKYISKNLEDYNLHQIMNINNNITEVQKYIKNIISFQLKGTQSKDSKSQLFNTLNINLKEQLKGGLDLLANKTVETSKDIFILFNQVKDGKYGNDSIKSIVKAMNDADKQSSKNNRTKIMQLSGYGSDSYKQAA